MTETMMTVKGLADHFKRSEDWVRALMKKAKILGGRATPGDIKQALVTFPLPLRGNRPKAKPVQTDSYTNRKTR